MPSAVIATPTSVRMPETKASHSMPVMMGGKVALFLGVLGQVGQLLATLKGRGLGTVERSRLLPVVDLLRQRGLVGVVGRRAELRLLGRGLHDGAADGFRLDEGPEVR